MVTTTHSGKKIKYLRGHDVTKIPFLIYNDDKITDRKEQTKILAETWDNTFKIQTNNANWANMNKVTNWINNNTSKIAPYKKANMTRLGAGDSLTSPISTNDITYYIKK
ncbi:unnamed protein product, partial [Meganyctiphanes norvegica]